MSTLRTLNPARIYAARLKAGLTQEQLAHRLRDLGVNASGRYINRWEKGHNTPRADVVPTLAEALGVSIAELFEPDGEDAEAASMAPLAAEPMSDMLETLAEAIEALREKKAEQAELADLLKVQVSQ